MCVALSLGTMENYHLIPTVNQHGLFVDERVSGYRAEARLPRVDRCPSESRVWVKQTVLSIATHHPCLISLLDHPCVSILCSLSPL